LRVATAIAPDTILVDAAFPVHIQRLLESHPSSARARILRTGTQAAVDVTVRDRGLTNAAPRTDVARTPS
jgi:hypothetical protein